MDVCKIFAGIPMDAAGYYAGVPLIVLITPFTLLTGLLGNLGMRDLSADLRAAPYLGARGIRFWVWPGSALAKKAGKWLMASELVETSRLFARCVADIEP